MLLGGSHRAINIAEIHARTLSTRRHCFIASILSDVSRARSCLSINERVQDTRLVSNLPKATSEIVPLKLHNFARHETYARAEKVNFISSSGRFPGPNAIYNIVKRAEASRMSTSYTFDRSLRPFASFHEPRASSRAVVKFKSQGPSRVGRNGVGRRLPHAASRCCRDNAYTDRDTSDHRKRLTAATAVVARSRLAFPTNVRRFLPRAV